MKKRYKILFYLVILITTFTILEVKVVKGGELKRTVYLTFDDGPSSINTEKVLEILNNNAVKGNFFVVGGNAVKYKEKLEKLREYEMGIYPHCNVHNYKQIYADENSYFCDLDACNKNLQNILGEEYNFNFVRLPGGATNEVSNYDIKNNILKELNKKGINYIDWNVDSGDAEAVIVSANKLKNNFKKNCGRYKVEVVLMHDTDVKDTTVSTLQELINTYKSKGYEFKCLDEITGEEIDYLTNTKVINRKFIEKK
ncbi:polysaccharide deacetylase family protein [uncultured Clostridium sp.]|uniref:polysaccharide deacetylase family protein n=1 Tax=uncultured Clostridium sp. TaxID=59620 RepID=UPI00260D74CE|nr:polysaccharide deacetylase family protein [uncultured Clostridium sp.]